MNCFVLIVDDSFTSSYDRANPECYIIYTKYIFIFIYYIIILLYYIYFYIIRQLLDNSTGSIIHCDAFHLLTRCLVPHGIYL